MIAHHFGCGCYDCRNAKRGGSTRTPWTHSPTVRAAQAKRQQNLLTAAWIMARIGDDVERQLHRDFVRKFARPSFLPELVRAVREWWHGEIRSNADAMETMAAGLAITAVTAAVLSTLFQMAMGR